MGFVAGGGCGQISSSTGGPAANYTISGKVGSITSQGIKTLAASEVTHIVAIGANNKKYVATPESNGTFSLQVVSGWPYALGFYNKTGSTIILLGYLRQSQVNWDSLPLMAPANSTTNLGTVEINAASVEATPSIALNDLLSQVNMANATATEVKAIISDSSSGESGFVQTSPTVVAYNLSTNVDCRYYFFK